jgi:hypothetical protein
MEHELTCRRYDNCKVEYSWQYTPIISYLVPAIVYPGMTVSVGINPMKAPVYKKDTHLPIDLRMDGTSFDLSALYDSDSNLG